MQLKRSFRATAVAFLIAGAPASSGCGLIYAEPSAVAQGEYYASGNPAFDEFFIKLHRFQVELAGAPDEAREVRADLAKSLGLLADAADAQIETRLREEARELAHGGARLKLELPADTAEPGSEDASVTVRTAGSLRDAEPFIAVVQDAATKLLRLKNRMRIGQKGLERLRVQSVEFEGQVDGAFRRESPWKRDEVRENIADGQKLITLMLARSDEIAAASDKLLEVVVRAATTDERLGPTSAPAIAAAEASAESAEEDAPKRKKPAQKKSGAKPARPAGKARPAAAPEAGEVAPAPKPPPAEAAPKEFEP